MSLPFPRALEEAVGMQRIGPVGSKGQDASGCASCYAYGVVCALLGASLQAVGLQVCLCGICCPCVLLSAYIPGLQQPQPLLSAALDACSHARTAWLGFDWYHVYGLRSSGSCII